MRTLVFQHLDQTFKAALDAIIGVRRAYGGYNAVEIIRHRPEEPENLIELLLSQHRDALAQRLHELLGTATFEFKPDELRQLRRAYRRHLIDKIEDHLMVKANEVAEQVVNHELRYLWMDDETVAIIEERMMGSSDGG